MDNYSPLVDASIPLKIAYNIVTTQPGTIKYLHQIELARQWLTQQGVNSKLNEILVAQQLEQLDDEE